MTVQPSPLPLPLIAVLRLFVPIAFESGILFVYAKGELSEMTWRGLYVFGVRVAVWRVE